MDRFLSWLFANKGTFDDTW